MEQQLVTNMKVLINSSSNKIFESDKVDYIELPGKAGILGVLNNHEPVISTLDVGIIRIKESGKEINLVINGGFAQIANNNVFILANEAEMQENLVKEEIENAIRNAENKISGKLEPSELIRLEKEIKYQKLKREVSAR